MGLSFFHPLRSGLVALLLIAGCTSRYQRDLGGDPERVVSKTYLANFDLAWLAALDALKSYPMDVSNREGGSLQTKWVENTAERNLVESFGPGVSYLKAQFRYRISLAKTKYDESDAVRISVQRSQLIQRDVLEGWKPIGSDEIEEKTLLYRIGQLISVKRRLQAIEDERTQRAVENSPLNASPARTTDPGSTPIDSKPQEQ